VRGLKVLLADDHEVVRRGLRSILEAQPDCEVVGEAADGRQAVAMTNELKPDIVLLDVGMPMLNGLEATRQILRMHPQTKILIVTLNDSDFVIRNALKAGVRGYVMKSDAVRDLVAAVESLRQNRTFFTPRVSRMISGGVWGSGSHPQDAGVDAGHLLRAQEKSRLTRREREVVRLLVEGKNSREIAAILGLSAKTIQTHRSNLMRKLDCHSIGEVVRYAIRNRIIEA
jgi:DNA-binding NarL/FixJ family response regulator